MTASSDKTARIWNLWTTRHLIENATKAVPRCLTREQRQQAFLSLEPPGWCIEMDKWPYQTQDWKEWLRFKRANANPPFPDTPEWQTWVAAHH